MNFEAKVYYGKKFFGHLLPRYQLLAVEACLEAQSKRLDAERDKPMNERKVE
jgi:hypothetical protein